MYFNEFTDYEMYCRIFMRWITLTEYSKALGDSVKRARGKLKLTQSEVASIAEVDVRTVLNIENYKGNPKFEVLCSIIRTLNLDTQEIFYPEIGSAYIPAADYRRMYRWRSRDAYPNRYIGSFSAAWQKFSESRINRKSLPLHFQRKQALRFKRHALLLNTSLNFTRSIRYSFLHFGQYSGKFSSTVFSYTFVRVLPPQIGHLIHSELVCDCSSICLAFR